MPVPVTLFFALFPTADSRALREQSLRAWYERENQPQPPALPFAAGPAGKPALQLIRAPHFSVSHSGPLWCCAVADVPLGLDVQQLRPARTEALAARFFHPEEQRWLRSRPPEAFFSLWAKKEAYIKYTGKGLAQGLASFSVIEPKGVTLSPIPCPEGFAGCLCTSVPIYIIGIVPLISGQKWTGKLFPEK